MHISRISELMESRHFSSRGQKWFNRICFNCLELCTRFCDKTFLSEKKSRVFFKFKTETIIILRRRRRKRRQNSFKNSNHSGYPKFSYFVIKFAFFGGMEVKFLVFFFPKGVKCASLRNASKKNQGFRQLFLFSCNFQRISYSKLNNVTHTKNLIFNFLKWISKSCPNVFF